MLASSRGKRTSAERLRELEKRTRASGGSWPIRRSTCRSCVRSPRETSEPDPETRGSDARAGKAGRLREPGLPSDRKRVWNTYRLLTGGTPVTVGPGAERTDSLFIRTQPEVECARSRSGSLKPWMGFFSDLGALNGDAQFSDPFELYSGWLRHRTAHPDERSLQTRPGLSCPRVGWRFGWVQRPARKAETPGPIDGRRRLRV
jgi:hypothetical protein